MPSTARKPTEQRFDSLGRRRRFTSPAVEQRDAILDRLRNGDNVGEIAQALGFASHAGVSVRFLDDPEYRAAREEGAAARMERREKQLEDAPDTVTVSRARELLSHARWRAEREFPARWGAKQQVEHTVAPVINFVFGAVDKSLVIEHEPVDNSVDKDA